jgi:hypothetical protein
MCLCILALACNGGGSGGDDGGGGLGGGGGGMEDGGNGGGGGAMFADCDPGSTCDCYSGAPGTANVGACKIGSETCNDEGSGWGECAGEVVPAVELVTGPREPMVDEDCDGLIDEPPGS